MSFSIFRPEIPDYEKLRRRQRNGAIYALDQLITEKLTRGPKTRAALVALGKAQEFTPADVRHGIDRLCKQGIAKHDTNKSGSIFVRLTKEGEA
ncbi:hypothetical protein SAMN05216369_3328 [Marinobacter antarcticus]|jgi:hypothetical protein|uniref:Uncharacterized protein n=1 Tax=Marinobacter antarcticus TaxID=564117 RepID=A0A1M6VPF1_9GAMM|nr:hypothetical protein [Marinobacter antarcticus]SHK83402.1 hypothetical protein SAMN05216369_3328 [Marinobacter antarcticus]